MMFVGKRYDENYCQIFDNKIKELSLENNIIISENFDNKEGVLDTASIVMIPSLKEGLSLVAVEAQSTGIMVFASKGVPEDVDLGNIVHLDLNSALWAEKIDNYFSKNKNYRHSVDTSKFSLIKFKEGIKKIYN